MTNAKASPSSVIEKKMKRTGTPKFGLQSELSGTPPQVLPQMLHLRENTDH